MSAGKRLRVMCALLSLAAIVLLNELRWLSQFHGRALDGGEASMHPWSLEPAPAVINSHQAYVHNRPLHVIMGLSGNHPGFFSELEVCLKSVLLNTPLERNLTIHLIADQLAYDTLDNLFDQTNITGWQSRTQVAIQTYNIQPHVKTWEQAVKDLCVQTGLANQTDTALTKHTLGACFRLFSYKVLPPDVVSAVYMDVDVVVTANLEKLMEQFDAQYAFQWGDSRCSGFMVLNLPRLGHVWESAAQLNLQNVSQTLKEDVTDQLVFMAVDDQYRHLAGQITQEWDLSIAAGAWRAQKRFAEVYPNLGMIHYNGGGTSKGPFWADHRYFSEDEVVRRGVCITAYYILLPWVWAHSYALGLTSAERTFSLQLQHRQPEPDTLSTNNTSATRVGRR